MRGFTISGLNHMGLIVDDIVKARRWFIDLLGFEVLEDRGELLFLLVGRDVLAIKTPKMAVSKPEHPDQANLDIHHKAGLQTLDHYGFFANSPEEVDVFADFLRVNEVAILKGPYTRSDGRSVYFRDPCGIVGEFFYFVSDM